MLVIHYQIHHLFWHTNSLLAVVSFFSSCSLFYYLKIQRNLPSHKQKRGVEECNYAAPKLISESSVIKPIFLLPIIINPIPIPIYEFPIHNYHDFFYGLVLCTMMTKFTLICLTPMNSISIYCFISFCPWCKVRSVSSKSKC